MAQIHLQRQFRGSATLIAPFHSAITFGAPSIAGAAGSARKPRTSTFRKTTDSLFSDLAVLNALNKYFFLSRKIIF